MSKGVGTSSPNHRSRAPLTSFFLVAMDDESFDRRRAQHKSRVLISRSVGFMKPRHSKEQNISRNDIELQRLHPKRPSFFRAPEEDDKGVEPDCWPLLSKHGTPKCKDDTSYHSRRASMRMRYHRAKIIVVQPWWRIVSLSNIVLSIPMAGNIKNDNLGYDRLAPPTVSRYIGEQDFWVLLQSFFGLGPHPALCLEQTSASKDKIPYIKSYLRSKPTPVDPWNGVDDPREMVKICTRLTESIFQNNHSKTILLRVDSQDLLSAIEENWDLFKGFGMICQYCDDVGPTQLDSDEVELPQAWLQVTCALPGRSGH